MSVFDLYAAYYDLLYRDKDYAAEAQYVASLLPGSAVGALSLLELGCGTGGHAFELARAGHRVHGIDLSAQMVARARARRAATPELQPRLQFDEGDVRSVRTGARYDAVISLFHVMSYQTGNQDLAAVFATARAHLAPGGHFAFDFWYGPAVLSDRPRHVIKEVADERIVVRRQTTPTLHVNDNRVDVRFDITITAREGAAVRQVVEEHPMRYLFLPEIDAFAEAAGFVCRAARAWMRDEPPSDRTWYASIVLEAVDP